MTGKSGTKRKKDKISPASQRELPLNKRTMASNSTPTATSGLLPPTQVYQYPQTPQYYSAPPLFNQLQQSPDPLQGILQRLETMDTKLNQLTSIQASVNKITQRLDNMDAKIGEIEQSQRFISQQYDTVATKSTENSQRIGKVQSDVDSISHENATLKAANRCMTEDLIDLKCRSMRDNLLFYGVMECPRQTSPFMAATKDAESYAGEEDCTSKVLQFCNSVLNIQDTKANIRIDRSHRIGKYKSDKIRPIVVKFLDSDSKNIVKHSLNPFPRSYTFLHVAL